MLKFTWSTKHERTAKETLKKALGEGTPPPRTSESSGGVWVWIGAGWEDRPEVQKRTRVLWPLST